MAAGKRRARARPRFDQLNHGQQSACPTTGKRSWHSQDAALAAAGKMPGKRHRRIYLCNHCGRWHITSKPKR